MIVEILFCFLFLVLVFALIGRKSPQRLTRHLATRPRGFPSLEAFGRRPPVQAASSRSAVIRKTLHRSGSGTGAIRSACPLAALMPGTVILEASKAIEPRLVGRLIKFRMPG